MWWQKENELIARFTEDLICDYCNYKWKATFLKILDRILLEEEEESICPNCGKEYMDKNE